MQVLLVLVILWWLVSLPPVVWWVLLAIILVGLAVAGHFVLNVAARVRVPWKQRASFDPSYVAALAEMASEAQAEVAALRAEVERIRSTAVVSEPDPNAALYSRVGLSPGAPVWLLAAARKAYRTALHPDRHPAHLKPEAERRFVQAESVFDEIASSRE